MNKIYILLILLITAFTVKAQQPAYNAYFPIDISSKDWSIAAHASYDNHNNSNYLTNEFSMGLNNSEFLNDELKDRQMNNIDGTVLVGRTSKTAVGVWFRNKKKQNNYFYYFGIDGQQVLDGSVDKDLVGLGLYGNKPYAGEQLNISNTEYMNIYFNRIKLGMGNTFGNNDIKHTFSGILGVTAGQNYDHTKLQSASFYTHPDGDYLDMNVQAETQLGDTVWADVFTVNGMGASLDLHYSMHKEKDFFIAVNLQNVGFVNWSKNPFSATADTIMHFEGMDNDTTNDQQIPDDFSYGNLRNIIFTSPDRSSFSEFLPFDINLTAGKFFSDGKFYVGLNTTFYPTLISNYRAELFATWNIKDKFQVTPIVAYSSYNKLNIGLAVGAQLWEKVYLRAGTSYLNSMFIAEAAAGQGGFVSIVFVR